MTPRHIRALDYATKAGVPRRTSAPLLFRALWALGIDAPPPLFAPFASTAVAGGALFALAFGAILWLLGDPATVALPLPAKAALAGAVFGVGLARSSASRRRRLNLPMWEQL